MSKYAKATLIVISSILLFCFLLLHTPLYSAYMFPETDGLFSFSLENGFYQNDIQVELTLSSHTDQLEIHYTLDGSTPTASSPLYTSPLIYNAENVVKNIVIKAIVSDHNQNIISGPYTASYFIGKNIGIWTNALVVSITSDAEGLYSSENGILYPMADCGPTEADWKWFEKQNCKQRGDDWIRDAHIDIFEPDGANVISQNIGLCVDGDHGSMTHYPYSLKILAGKEYDPLHETFSYDFFHYYNTRGTQFPHIQDFNNLVFRNGGNEYNAGAANTEQRGTMLRWNVGSRLADEAGYMVAGARPVMVFLNGELYSVAQLQDTYNKHNTSVKTLIGKDFLEIYKDTERACTKQGGYEDLYYSYPDVESSPILEESNQEKLEELVSVDDMFSYYAFQVLVNNTDFPKKNYAIWRYTKETSEKLYSDGKYRFFINDLDCTWDFRYDDDLWTAYFKNIKEDGTVMGSLIQIQEYKTSFLNTLCDLMNSGLFDPEHLDEVINTANSDFQIIASYFYTPKDEAKRQQNVTLLKESAIARKEKVRGFIQDTFAPEYPYILSVKAPESGTSIRFSTTQLISSDEDFRGTYYGDYPMTLSPVCNSHKSFSHWLINGKKITSPEVTLDASFIQDGKITVELVTVPSIQEDGSLLISEVYTDDTKAWIELYNASAEDVDISQYRLANNIPARLINFQLPQQILAPGETFVAGIDNTGVFRMEQGKTVYLLKDSIVSDSLTIPIMAKTESYGRFGETDEWRYYPNPTEGVVN